MSWESNRARSPTFVAYSQRVNLVDAPPPSAPVCRDPDDDLVLVTALASQAEVIMTGHKDLLILKAYRGGRVVSPGQFLEMPLAQG